MQRRYGYEPFGTRTVDDAASKNAPSVQLGFAGEYADPQTGLYDLRARRYDPSTGQFTQPDPAPAAVGDPYASTYTYAHNAPTMFVDPSGECVFGRNPDGSCRGGRYARAAADTAASAGRWAWKHKRQIAVGGVAVGATLIGCSVGPGGCVAGATFGSGVRSVDRVMRCGLDSSTMGAAARDMGVSVGGGGLSATVRLATVGSTMRLTGGGTYNVQGQIGRSALQSARTGNLGEVAAHAGIATGTTLPYAVGATAARSSGC